jgi:hypothetical protein
MKLAVIAASFLPSVIISPRFWNLQNIQCMALFVSAIADFEGSILRNPKVSWILDSRFQGSSDFWIFQNRTFKMDHKLKQTGPTCIWCLYGVQSFLVARLTYVILLATD